MFGIKVRKTYMCLAERLQKPNGNLGVWQPRCKHLFEKKYVFLDINENDDVILLRTLSSGIEVLSCILFSSTSLILDCC